MNKLTEKIFMDLNEAQLEAVTATEGYYRIIAGAGSGKTKALTHRFAYLVNDLGIDSHNILCVTFTSKAAAEMKNRIKNLLGDGHDGALITTYHGFCVKVLKEDIHTLFYPENFKILDKKEQKKILEGIYAEYDVKMDYNTFEKILEYIQENKRKSDYVPLLTDPSYVFDPAWSEDMDDKIYQRYLQTQKKLFALDFNDLIYFVLYLFENNLKVLNKWRTRLHYIQVDEFQDSSKKEVDIINFLCSGNDNLFVVGDPDQNIYEWRKSKNSFLVDFDKKYPNVKTIFLNQNYRSTPEILDVSNDLIDKNKNRIKKSLFTLNESGSKAEFYHCSSEAEEAKKIVEKIKNLTEKEYKLSDIAILYRSSYVSRFIEQTLYKSDIPYQIYGGIKFFERSEIKDCLAFLRLMHENDDNSLLRIINTPARRIGKPKVMFLKDIQQKIEEERNIKIPLFDILCNLADSEAFENTGAKEFTSIIRFFKENKENFKTSDLLNAVIEKVRYKAYIVQNGDMERLDNIVELINSMESLEKSYGEHMGIGDYLQQVAIMSDYESEKSKNSIKLMTIHASKGLEFPCVLIVGLTDGVFPSKRSLEMRKEEGLEEERRLLYVALTRAQKELCLFESESGESGNMLKLPSRFLFDISEKYLSVAGIISDEIKNLLAKQIKSLNKDHGNIGNATNQTVANTFKVGDKIIHSVFGSGEIIELNNINEIYLIKFRTSKNPKPISMKFQGLKPDDTADGESDFNADEFITEQISNANVEAESVPLADNVPPEKSSEISDAQFNVPLYGNQLPVITDNGSKSNLWNDPAIPKTNWYCVNVYDLGTPVGNCGMCGKDEIRYVHIMRHDCGMTLGVGCICAGKMEGNIENAKKRESELKNKSGRLHHFLNSDLKKSAKGNFYTKYKGILITFLKARYDENKWQFVAGNEFSGKFNTIEEAKIAAFMKCDSMDLDSRDKGKE